MNKLVSTKCENLIKEFIELNKKHFFNLYNSDYLSDESLKDVVLFLLCDEDFSKDNAQNLITKYFFTLRKNLETVGIKDYGFLGGSGFDLFIVDFFRKKYGGMNHFYKTFEEEILNLVNLKSVEYKNKNTQPYYYDVVRGLSGALYYFVTRYKNDSKELDKLIGYLIFLTNEKFFKEMNLTNFHVPYDPIDLGFEENGYINFSLSHGMLGPLITLSKVKSNGYKAEGLDESIENILKTYDKFKKIKFGVEVWPTQLDAKNFSSGNWEIVTDPRKPFCLAWCYGNMSIIRGLAKTYKLLNDKRNADYYKNQFIKLINTNLENFGLSNPNLCHGYASVITEIICMYKEFRDPLLVERLEELVYLSIESYKSVNRNLEIKYRKNELPTIGELDGSYKNINFLNGSTGLLLSLKSVITLNTDYAELLLVDPV